MKVTKITKIVAYYRLSKPKKGKTKNETIRDAYGLEDQRREVARIAAEYGARIIGEFVEVETGTNRKARRPELQKAILMAQMHRATLVIGKQDRLARNTHFITGLMEKGIRFMCADAPEKSEAMIEFQAVMDASEARAISDRTKRGLAIAREKGKKLGSARPGHWKGREHLRGWRQAAAASAEVRHQRSVEAAEYLIDLICEMQAAGASLETIANRLNELGHVTTRGKPFSDVTVLNILRLCGKRSKPARPGKGKCSRCGREFRISWQQRQQHEKGETILCLDDQCVKDVNGSMEQVIEEMSKRGKFPVDIADALNHLGYVTPRGKRFNKYNMTYLMKSLEPVS